MKAQIEALYSVSQKETRILLGLMSGTSLDGLDMALCAITGTGRQTSVKLLEFKTFAFPDSEKQKILEIFAKPTISFEHLTVLNAHIGRYHGAIINDTLKEWNISKTMVDAIASHGQTVYHAPKHQQQETGWPNATLQIGDADHIAVETGILTLSDFRQKNIAAGGEGAPLAIYADALIFTDKEAARVLLNMGGIGNFTYLPAANNAQGKVFVTDTGPSNTLIDLFSRLYFNVPFDQDSKLALKGQLSTPLFKALYDHPFFAGKYPLSTGPELFGYEFVQNALNKTQDKELSPHDILHTLSYFSAYTITQALKNCVEITDNLQIYASGGGAHNPLINKYLKQLLPNVQWLLTDQLGIPGDAKEAVLFAVLANQTLSGQEPYQFSNPLWPSVSMGKISFPN
jgi:anhydro-N-acetylmuramic acid kinase